MYRQAQRFAPAAPGNWADITECETGPGSCFNVTRLFRKDLDLTNRLKSVKKELLTGSN